MVRDDLVCPLVHRLPVGHINIVRGDMNAERSGLCGRFLEPLLVDVGEREPAVTACEIESKRPPNAGACARDRRHLICEFLHS